VFAVVVVVVVVVDGSVRDASGVGKRRDCSIDGFLAGCCCCLPFFFLNQEYGGLEEK
jgi:hypothetical protein